MMEQRSRDTRGTGAANTPYYNGMDDIPTPEEGLIGCSQINLHHCIDATHTLNEWMANTNMHTMGAIKVTSKVALIQEPYLSYGKVKDISKDYNIFIGKENSKTRSCIVTTKNVVAWLLGQFSDEDQVAIAIESDNNITVLASTYMPWNSVEPPPPENLKNLVKYCEDKNWKLIIGADANSHHISWGSTDVNIRGDNLLDFIMSSNIHICNRGTQPTFVNIIREQVIDITLASTNIIDDILEWKVSKDITFSDHKRIEFFLRTKHVHLITHYRNIRKTKWNLYEEKLQTKLESQEEHEDMESEVKHLENSLIESYHESCKLITKTISKKPPWWDANITFLRKEAKRFKRRVERSKTLENQREWCNAKNTLKNAIRRAKSEGWENFCSEMQDLTATARIQKVFRQGKGQTIGSLKKPNGEFTVTPEETLEILLDTHFPDHGTVREDNVSIHSAMENMGKLNLDDVVNLESVRAAIGSFKPYKSPGNDGIFPILLQKGLNHIDKKLVKIYKESLRTGKIPGSWLETKVVFIPKPGKADYCDPKSFRPISLSSFLLKGLERLIFWHINNTTLKDNPLNSNLYSYREGISTEDAIHSLVHKIEKALENKEVAVLLFLDIDAAFSNASIEGMIKNMEKQGIEPEIVRWTEYMLRNRLATATLNLKTVIKIILEGTPQGGILSVLLWNLVMNDLLKRFPKVHPSITKAFADDVAGLAVGKVESIVIDIIQQDVRIYEEWAHDNKLSFSQGKTKAMFITKRRKFKLKPLYLKGKEIEWVDNIKYLGVILDNKLSWKPHIKRATEKATMAMAQCRKMIGKTWGLNPRVCKWIYTAIIRPIVSYGGLVWGKCLETLENMEMLNKLQRKGCLSILNALKSTPTEGMEIIIGITPLHLHIKTTIIMSYTRLVASGNWTAKQGEPLSQKSHSKTIERWCKKIPEIKFPRDKLINKVHMKTQFQTEILPRETIRTLIIPLTPSASDVVNCFTDGSKNESSSGAGFIVRGSGIKLQGFLNLGIHSTVFQTELVALKLFAQKLIEKNTKEKIIQVYTDSQASIRALGKYETTSKCVLECKRVLNELSTNNELKINWIPGHEGFNGNEIADRLANIGTNMETPDSDPLKPDIPVATSVIKAFVTSWETKRHQENFYLTNKYRQTKIFLPNVDRNVWKDISRLNRKETRLITQILTGHSDLNYHLHKRKLIESPICDLCEESEETSMHFIGQCPYYARIRYDVFGSFFLRDKELKDINTNKFLNFIRISGRFEFPQDLNDSQDNLLN